MAETEVSLQTIEVCKEIWEPQPGGQNISNFQHASENQNEYDQGWTHVRFKILSPKAKGVAKRSLALSAPASVN